MRRGPGTGASARGQDVRSSAVAKLRRDFQEAVKLPARSQTKAAGDRARDSKERVQFKDGSLEQEYVHNLQQQIYFLELECQFLRASLESGGHPGTDASGFHVAEGVGPGSKANRLREELDTAERENHSLKEKVRVPRGERVAAVGRPRPPQRPDRRARVPGGDAEGGDPPNSGHAHDGA